MKEKRKLQIHKVIDKTEKFYTPKKVIADVPFRMLVVGKSHLSGKTNFCCNMYLKPEFYLNDFEGKNMFIVSGSLNNDCKLQTLIREKEIPHQNLIEEYDEDFLEVVYETIEEEYEEAIEEGKRPKNYCIFFDDMSYSGHLKKKKNGIISKMFSNGRHINLSCVITAQKFTDILPSARENATIGIFFNCSDRQLESIQDDFNYYGERKPFKKMFRETTIEPHSFLVVNFTNKPEEMYMNKDFEPIKMSD